jgi:hypothetical protein
MNPEVVGVRERLVQRAIEEEANAEHRTPN